MDYYCFSPCKHFQKSSELLNNCEKTKTVLSLVADLMSQEKINRREHYLLGLNSVPSPHLPSPTQHSHIENNSSLPPFLPLSTLFIDRGMKWFFKNINKTILSAYNPLMVFSFVRGKAKVSTSSFLKCPGINWYVSSSLLTSCNLKAICHIIHLLCYLRTPHWKMPCSMGCSVGCSVPSVWDSCTECFLQRQLCILCKWVNRGVRIRKNMYQQMACGPPPHPWGGGLTRKGSHKSL